MTGILAGIAGNSNLPAPTFRDGTEIPRLGGSDIPLFDGGELFGPLSTGNTSALRTLRAQQQARRNFPQDSVDIKKDTRTSLEKADDIAKRGASLQQRLQLFQNLYATSPGTIGPLIEELDAEIIELFKEYQELTDGPKIVGPDGEALKAKTIVPGKDRVYTAAELLKIGKGEKIPNETIYVNADGEKVTPVPQDDDEEILGPNGEVLTARTIIPGIDRAFTSAELLSRLKGKTIPEETIYVDANGKQVTPVDPDAEEPAPVAGVDRAYTVAELLARAKKAVNITV